MAQTIVKNFTYAGSPVLVECANRDKAGNVISDTYAKKNQTVRFDGGTLDSWVEGNIIICNAEGQPEITCSDFSLSQISTDIGNIQNVINGVKESVKTKLDTSVFNTYINTTAPNEYVKILNFKTNYLDANKVAYTTNLKTINSTSLVGTGDITINKTSIGLGNVDNTSDADKPISTAVNTALNTLGNEVQRVKNTATAAGTTATSAMQKANDAYSLASGRTKAYSFSTKAEMENALKTADRTKYRVGDMLLIVSSLVPDYWITEVLEGTPGTYGFYKIAPLETSIDLTSYQTKADMGLQTTSKRIVDAINEVNDAIYNLQEDTIKSHIDDFDNPHQVTKVQVGLGSVVNTGDSATPVSGGTTKFTTGGAFTELNKKINKPSFSVGSESNPIYYNSTTSAFSTCKNLTLPNGDIVCRNLSVGSTNVGPAITTFNSFRTKFEFTDVTINFQ